MYNPQLETFIHVADAGSFNKAAEELFITPPAVIKQITSLENSLDIRLFDRSHRGLTLTEAGASIYRDAKYIIQYCKDSEVRAKNAALGSEHIIRIGTSPMTPGQFLIDLWPKIHEQCPDIKFQLLPYDNTPENSREILKNMGQKIDIVAGIFDDGFLANRGCAALELSREPILCAVSIRHPLAQKDCLHPSDLQGENLLFIRRNWNEDLDRMRDDLLGKYPDIHFIDFEQFTIHVFNQCEDSEDIMIAINSWQNVHPMLKLIPVDWDYTVSFGLLHAPKPSDTVQRFLDAVKTVFE